MMFVILLPYCIVAASSELNTHVRGPYPSHWSAEVLHVYATHFGGLCIGALTRFIGARLSATPDGSESPSVSGYLGAVLGRDLGF